ncbi:MAG: metalloregulator ArsR/SmtB family transcription factor [Hyphomicrobiaceae bacterium]|nr:metalloregulator ArsR/SmtB family transcription factor [Hyphomicrobiaceae bacterium]MCC0024895.1 metalloregulator ArsR/SmtB family transcription factor [Hyphomicrobiaceae bacterium]
MAGLQQSVDALKAAGEPTRLRLLALLSAGELTVKDLTDILGQSQPRISRHLKLLADAGLVERHSEGAWAYFRLADIGGKGGLARYAVELVGSNDEVLRADHEALKKLRDQQRARANSFFADVAESWDALRKIHVSEETVEAAILKAVGERKYDLMVDLGTGTGRMLELLAAHYVRGIGVDSSRDMLAVARARINEAGLSQTHVRHGDVTCLDLEGEAADLITIHQVLHYFDHPRAVLERAAELLRSNGRVVVVDFAPHELEFLRAEQAHRRLGLSEDQMNIWASGAGLQVSSCLILPPSKGAGDKALTVCVWTLEKAKLERNSDDI